MTPEYRESGERRRVRGTQTRVHGSRVDAAGEPSTPTPGQIHLKDVAVTNVTFDACYTVEKLLWPVFLQLHGQPPRCTPSDAIADAMADVWEQRHRDAQEYAHAANFRVTEEIYKYIARTWESPKYTKLADAELEKLKLRKLNYR